MTIVEPEAAKAPPNANDQSDNDTTCTQAADPARIRRVTVEKATLTPGSAVLYKQYGDLLRVAYDPAEQPLSAVVVLIGQQLGEHVQRLIVEAAYVPPAAYEDRERVVCAGARGALINAVLFDPRNDEFYDGEPMTLSVYSEPGSDADLDAAGATRLIADLDRLRPKLCAMRDVLAAEAAEAAPPSTLNLSIPEDATPAQAASIREIARLINETGDAPAACRQVLDRIEAEKQPAPERAGTASLVETTSQLVRDAVTASLAGPQTNPRDVAQRLHRDIDNAQGWHLAEVGDHAESVAYADSRLATAVDAMADAMKATDHPQRMARALRNALDMVIEETR
jgi:hypothetical protein